MEKLPPIAKVYEAWSAVADGRMVLHPNERCATVASSNAQKEYTVTWDEADAVHSSKDNATYWQGYAGYPVIAVLMEQGALPLDRADENRIRAHFMTCYAALMVVRRRHTASTMRQAAAAAVAPTMKAASTSEG